MAFCKYSSEFISNNQTSVDNLFINEFLPNAPDNCVRVYLYGLLKCTNPDSYDNNIENFSKILNLSESDIVSSFMYWEELGLIQILSQNPLEIRYLPIKKGSQQLKKFNTDKYKNFNTKVQDIICGRQIAPLEFQEYYYLIENLHLDEDALLMIIEYCVKIKNNKIAYPYILSVAKSWIADGITTCEDVENRFADLDKNSGDIALVLKKLGLKRRASNEEYNQFLHWKNDYEISLDVMLYLADISKTSNYAFQKLAQSIDKCYTNKLTSIKEIDDYFSNEEKLYALSKKICRNLGVRYENLGTIIDHYLLPWTSLGFGEEILTKISNYCFRVNIRTMEGMNEKITLFFNKGILSSENLDNYIAEAIKNDAIIGKILAELNIDRAVSSNDRMLYKTWIYTWNTNPDIIDYAVTLGKGKYLPLQFINNFLADINAKNLTTLEDVKKYKPITTNLANEKKSTGTSSKKSATPHEYTKEQLNSVFDNIFEVEI